MVHLTDASRPPVTLVVRQSGTVHDGVLAESGLRDSGLHELYGCMYAVYFTTRPTCKFCMPSNSDGMVRLSRLFVGYSGKPI